jgi:hypothetical protein
VTEPTKDEKAKAAAAESKAPKGTHLFRLTTDYYRDGLYMRRGDVVAIPTHERPGKGWTKSDDAPDHVFQDTPEKKAAREANAKEQEEREQRAAETAARDPSVRATAIAAREAAKLK